MRVFTEMPDAANIGQAFSGKTENSMLRKMRPLHTSQNTFRDCFLQALEGLKDMGNGQFVALCPAHHDRTPSLSVKIVADRILLYCFAGCSTDEITSALGLTTADLFLKDHPPQQTRPTRRKPVHLSPRPEAKRANRPRRVAVRDRRLSGEWEFHDEAGKVLAVKRRYDFTAIYADGTEEGEKTFEVSYTGDRVPLPLYELPAVLSAIRQRWPVYLLEGERKADTLNDWFRHEWGLDAVATSYGGHWRKDMADTLKGATRAVIVPDRDNAGQRKAQAVSGDFVAAGVPCTVCDLSGMLAAMEAGEDAI